MLQLDPYLLLMLIGFLYVLVFGGLGLLRREGLSFQFALEAIVLTGVLLGGAWLLNANLNPFLFLGLLYLVTMRSRLLVDAANFALRRGRTGLAFRLYHTALGLRPDATSRLIVRANRGAAELYVGHLDAAIKTMEAVLAEAESGHLGMKYEAVTHYNLGYAYERAGNEGKAVACYNETIEQFPGTLYARAAAAALKRRKDRSV